MNIDKDYYAILGVVPTAEAALIKAAELGAENPVLLPEVIVLQGQLFLEELLDLDQERMRLIFGVYSHGRNL